MGNLTKNNQIDESESQLILIILFQIIFRDYYFIQLIIFKYLFQSTVDFLQFEIFKFTLTVVTDFIIIMK